MKMFHTEECWIILGALDSMAVALSDSTLWPHNAAYDDVFRAAIDDLRLFRVTQTNPLLLNVIQEFPSPKEVAKAFRVVANFAFRYFIIGNQSPGNMERLSAEIAYHVREKTYTSASGIADALRAANPDPAFRADFTLAVFKKPRARLARYALARINNHLARLKPNAERVVDTNAKNVNLEHVLPQSVPVSWRASFTAGVDPEEYVYRLGNLTLLNSDINNDIGDQSFQSKKAIALDLSSLEINGFFKGISVWSDKEIEQRQDNLAKTAIEVWKLGF